MNRLALPTQLVAPRRAYVFLATAALATLVALTISVSTSRAAVVFSGAPGTGPPPAFLGPYLMTPFANDARPLGALVATVPAPLGLGNVSFNPSVIHWKVTMGWATWSHGYLGDVYQVSGGGTAVTMTLPVLKTKAFYFYAEPNPFAVINITATTDDGTTSGPIPVNGNGGARYFGFFTLGADTIASITVTSTANFAVGEFGIAGGPFAGQLQCPPYPLMGPCVVFP
jgi:hypothetical protein